MAYYNHYDPQQQLASKMAAAQAQGYQQPPPSGAPGYPPQQQQYGQPLQQQYQAYVRNTCITDSCHLGDKLTVSSQGQPQPYGAPQQPGAPQQQYGARPPQAPPAGGSSISPAQLSSVLKEAVQENGLQHVYNDQQIQALAQQLQQRDPVGTICQRWNIPMEIGFDLVKLALYDVAFLLDDSGSMRFGDGLIDELKFLLQAVAFASSLFDQDGFSVRFMNSGLEGNNVRTPEQAEALVNQVKFEGVTPLAGSLHDKILMPLVYNPANRGALNKPVLVIIITDGQVGERSYTEAAKSC